MAKIKPTSISRLPLGNLMDKFSPGKKEDNNKIEILKLAQTLVLCAVENSTTLNQDERREVLKDAPDMIVKIAKLYERKFINK